MEQHKARETPGVLRDSGDVPPEYSLLTTKLNVPSTRTNIVTRSRLLRRLDEGTSRKLTLISAPAGFGKTTVLGDWILRSALPVGWISLDAEDNDPARFLSYLVAALRTVEAVIGQDETSSRLPTRTVLTDLVNEIAAVPEDFAIVLDDYHLIEDETVHATLGFLLEHLPPQMHLVIAGRTEPPLPLSRLLAGGDLMKLTASDLRFTSGEAADFLDEAMGLDLSAGEVAELEERTEGWIAALQLAALSVRGREDISGFVSSFAGTDRDIFDYLAEEVLDRQAEETQTFLLRTSILDRMSGALCAAVTDQEGAQRTLENLERANLLIVPLDDRRRWYRYHHLFSGFLRERLRRENPEIVSTLHRRASVWHESNGTMSEAVGHVLAAGDFGRAGVMIEGLMDSTTARGEVPALEVMIKSLPEEVLRSTPSLCSMYAISVLMPAGRWDAAEAWLQAAERKLHVEGEDSAKAQSVTPTEALEAWEEQLAMVVGARAIIAMSRGDIQGSISLNRRTLELFPDEKRTPVLGVPANNLSECLLDIGDLAAAKAAIGEAAGIGRAADAPAITAWSLCLLGRLETTEGRLSEATQAYERVFRLADELGEGAVLMEAGAARVRMGELLLERNDPEAATRKPVACRRASSCC